MCDHNPREPAMTVLGENVWCDPCIAPIVKALNDGGLVTVASCCGHGQRLGSVTLADGRWFVIVPSDEAVDRLAALPTHIAGATAPNPEANLTAERDAAVARAEAAEAELKRCRAYRLVMAVFGVPEEAPQPFALLGDDDKPFALGVQWPGGAVTVKSTPPERLGNVTSPSLDDYFTEYGTSPVVWLSEDLGTLAEHEERAMAAEARVQAVRNYAKARAISAHIGRHFGPEREWLDVLHLLDAPADNGGTQ